MPIVWSPEYETGDRRVDSQHQHLFEYVNNLHALILTIKDGAPINKRTIEDFLFDLDTYVTVHFAYEEMCMGIRKCPLAALNKEVHAKLIAFYTDFAAKAKQDVTLEMLMTLENTLAHWLNNHICRIDISIKDAPDAGRL